MESNVSSKPKYKLHSFSSADGTSFAWSERQESFMVLQEEEISQLRETISQLPDEIILNDVSGNGIPMGVAVPLSEERLQVFLDAIVTFIKMRQNLRIKITDHAQARLDNDRINGIDHEDFRGWLCEEDIHHCVCTIHRLDGARLTVDRHSITSDQKRFHSPLALAVRGERPDGAEGILALAIIEENMIRIITILKSKEDGM